MENRKWLSVFSAAGNAGVLGAIGERLSGLGLALSDEEIRMLASRRDEALRDAERVEFGMPALMLIAEEVATSPCLVQNELAHDLAELQDAFYTLRADLPADVPDSEIAQALRGCLGDRGSAEGIASMEVSEVMRFSDDYQDAVRVERAGDYRIADEEGRVYSFDAAEWGYDEQARGWDGEGWGDDWDD